MAGSGILPPLESSRFISETSEHVKIKSEGVSKVAKLMHEKIKDGTYNIKSWKQHELNPKTMNKEALDWIFLVDTLNFSFWSADESKKFVVKYKGKSYTGYWSLCAAVNRAVDAGIPLTDPTFYAELSMEQLKEIFRSDSSFDIPMLEERLEVMHQAGKILLQKYNGSFVNCILKCNKNAQSLLKLITEDFPSFRDVTEYKGKQLGIYKRAQILIADIWACFEGQGYGEFHDIDTITMFADYRIPQALVYFGAMKYSEKLTNFLRTDHLLTSGDIYEVEIRGCSIWCTELIKQETERLLGENSDTKDHFVNSILIDHYLWDYRRLHADDMTDVPFHRIRCIYY